MSDSFRKIRSVEEVKKELDKFLGVPVDSKVDIKEANKEEIKVLDVKEEFEKEQLYRVRDDNEARRKLRGRIFIVTVLWMFLVLCLVFCCGMGLMHLSDSVLITLITTTTANVFGFFYVVVNYLFNKDRST